MIKFNAKVDSKSTLTPFETLIHNNQINAVANEYEIITWGLTDKRMQEMLESIPYKGDKTMFDAFVETVRAVLGLSPKEDTALSELLSISSRLFDSKVSVAVDAIVGKNTGGLLNSKIPIINMDARLLFNEGGKIALTGKRIVGETENGLFYLTNFGEGSIRKDKLPKDMIRSDGSLKSAVGYLGPIQNNDGRKMTEFSIGVKINGKETEIPSLIPGLTKNEIAFLKKGNVPESVAIKAKKHALKRMEKGKNFFYQDGE